MRAFAKALDINVGSLSGLMSGKRQVTTKTAIALCEKLGIDPKVKTEILLSIVQGSDFNHEDKSASSRLELDQEIFRTISNWYHWGILQLIKTKLYNTDAANSKPKWIARQFGITEMEAKVALERLLKLNLIKLDKGFYRRVHSESLTTADKSTTSSALRKWQKELREKAIFSLENDPIEVRSMTSMTMAINPKKLPEAKKIIDDFQESLAALLEEDSQEYVYQLETSLFPIQKLDQGVK